VIYLGTNILPGGAEFGILGAMGHLGINY